MKNQTILIAIIGLTIMASCVGSQLNPPYSYNSNPNYTWGYAEFYGAYYAEYKNPNHVISLSLFSDSLKINDIGNLVGIGQYLFLEDVFIPITDTLLTTGTYTIDDSGKPFSIAVGKNDTIDNVIYPIGASISYFEGNTVMSRQKLITQGTITISKFGLRYNVICNLKTSDKKELKGSFTALLPQTNLALAKPNNVNRKRLIYLQK